MATTSEKGQLEDPGTAGEAASRDSEEPPLDGTATAEETLTADEDPLSWPASKRWTCTIIVVMMTATIAFCSSIHTAAITSVALHFNCSRTVSTLGVTTFLLGFASGPLIFAPMSEVLGRNLIYRITLLLFVVFNLGCALAPNIAALLLFRFLCGFFGSPTGTRQSFQA